MIILNKKCQGCGAILQDQESNEVGYVRNLKYSLCERCFRIKNYSEYKVIVQDNEEYIKILKEVDKTNDLVLFVVDVFFMGANLEKIRTYINNPMLLVLTKRDVLPYSVSDQKIKDYMHNLSMNFVDVELISSYKNYNFDQLYEKILRYKKGPNVYVIGFTNAGKSTMINKILYHYSDNKMSLTTSIMPSTTLNSIEVKVNQDLTLIDTPGLVVDRSLINFVDGSMLSKIMPQKEIKPITYQIKGNQMIKISDFLILDIPMGNDLTIYMSNNLEINRYYKGLNTSGYREEKMKIKADRDLVFEGLGFIHFKEECTITVYTKYDMKIYTRKKLI